MRQLLPTPLESIDVLAMHASDDRPTPAHRPWLMVNMIASVDGASAVDERSGALGGPADKLVFRALRAVSDVILVGAATVRAEGYGPVRLDEEAVAMRRTRGQRDVPRLAIVSGSLDLDVHSAMFAESAEPPVVFTSTGADARRIEALAAVAEVVPLGAELHLADALRWLRDGGAASVLSEGGPRVNAQLIDEDLVDEWCQTISPMLVAGSSSRVAHVADAGTVGTVGPDRSRLRLARVLEQDDLLFARYVRAS